MSSCSLCKTTTGRFEAAAEVANVLHVSSACMSTVDKMMNNNGPKTDSWKTPCVISLYIVHAPRR